jgi:two-component system, OmpR family, response regulator CpxR
MQTFPSRGRVLLVEDAVDQARLLRRWLELEHFSVTLAHDGAAGLALCRRAEFDVVVSDLELPFSRGIAIVAWSKQEFPERPVIITTALARLQDVDAEAAERADSLLSMPLERSIFTSIVLALHESSLAWREQRTLRLVLEHAALSRMLSSGET